MKKLTLVLSSALLLSACTAGVDVEEAVPREANIKHVCIDDRRTGVNYTLKETIGFIQNSLKKKNITSEVFRPDANCTNVLKYRFKGKKDLMVSGRMNLVQLGDEKKYLGQVEYYRRGEERAISNQIGFEGQIDKMISELFKNY